MPGLLEPVVGTRSPLPGGTGGGLSQEAILRAILTQRMQQQAQPNLGLGSLQANPLTNPRAILDAQMRAQGQ